MNTVHSQVEHLKILLRHLSLHHSAQSEFSRKLGKRLNRNVNRNFANKILTGEINFNRSWLDHLEVAIEVAQEIKLNFERKKESHINLKSTIVSKANSSFLEEQLEISETLFLSGQIRESDRLLNSLISVVSQNKLRSKTPNLLARLYSLLALSKMQLGILHGDHNALDYSLHSVVLYEKLNEPESIIKSNDLLGQILRQRNQLGDSIALYQRLSVIIDQYVSTSSHKMSLLSKVKHQISLGMSHSKDIQNKKDLGQLMTKLMKESNDHFKHSNEKDWYDFSRLREAEVNIKIGNYDVASDLLSRTADTLTLKSPRESILLRIIAEFNIKTGKSIDAESSFNSALNFAKRHEFSHEVERILTIRPSAFN